MTTNEQKNNWISRTQPTVSTGKAINCLWTNTIQSSSALNGYSLPVIAGGECKIESKRKLLHIPVLPGVDYPAELLCDSFFFKKVKCIIEPLGTELREQLLSFIFVPASLLWFLVLLHWQGCMCLLELSKLLPIAMPSLRKKEIRIVPL